MNRRDLTTAMSLMMFLAGCLDLDAPPPLTPEQRARIDRLRAEAENGTGSWATVGDAYRTYGRLLTAADAYRAAAAQPDSDPAVRGKLAQVYLELGYQRPVIRELRTCLKDHPRESECLYAFGRLLEQDGAPSALREARRVYTQFLEVQTDHPEATRVQSVLRQLGGPLAQADVESERSQAPGPSVAGPGPEDEAPDKPELNPFGAALASALDAARAGRVEDAVAFFREALEIRPGHPNALAGLAEAEWSSGRREQAFRTLNEALAVGGEDPQVLFVAGALYLRDGRPQDVRRVWGKLRDLHPRIADQLGISERLASMDRSGGQVRAPNGFAPRSAPAAPDPDGSKGE
ncbi:MAG: tetratricopeptide repeat protein [Myxococcota bacterium]